VLCSPAHVACALELQSPGTAALVSAAGDSFAHAQFVPRGVHRALDQHEDPVPVTPTYCVHLSGARSPNVSCQLWLLPQVARCTVTQVYRVVFVVAIVLIQYSVAMRCMVSPVMPLQCCSAAQLCTSGPPARTSSLRPPLRDRSYRTHFSGLIRLML
jgi:hypothetical protein